MNKLNKYKCLSHKNNKKYNLKLNKTIKNKN